MAQFTAQGRVKLLGNGEVRSVGLGSKDPLPRKLRSVSPHGRKLRSSAPSAKLRSSSPSSSLPTSPSSNEGSHNVSGGKPRNEGEEGVHVEGGDTDYSDDEFGDDDDLACFRGLVLDLSYRSLPVALYNVSVTRFSLMKLIYCCDTLQVLQLHCSDLIIITSSSA